MSSENNGQYDVAIIGGGPGGSTTGSLLKKYNPALKVAIFEKEKFPREHIGESLLPPIGGVLNEMGAWDKVEAADFPIKFGATYTWGKTTDPWIFHFIPPTEIKEDPRPAPYGGWRARVAFQVDRAVYDEILLNHAAELGCEVRQETRVAKVHNAGGVVESFELEDGERVRARYYIDASGNAATLRRALGLKVDCPTLLQNVAFWTYWSKPGLNGPIWDKSATRIQIRSLPYGWIWFIALSYDRTSVGVVCPAEYYKNCGKRPEDLYHESLQSEGTIRRLLDGASHVPKISATNDWSFVCDHVVGPNWFLCGECLGFADPILSAGMTLTHTCARHCAYTILELDRGVEDPKWLRDQYSEIQRKRVRQHMKFAEYWYSANGVFDAIRENCTKIAEAAGLKLDPAEAFRWLSNGGLDDITGQVALGGLDLAGIKGIQQRFTHDSGKPVGYLINGKNVFELNLRGATRGTVATLAGGRIQRTPAYFRGEQKLVHAGFYGILIESLQKHKELRSFYPDLQARLRALYGADAGLAFNQSIACLELMANDYWVTCSTRRGEPALNVETPYEGTIMHSAAPIP